MVVRGHTFQTIFNMTRQSVCQGGKPEHRTQLNSRGSLQQSDCQATIYFTMPRRIQPPCPSPIMINSSNLGRTSLMYSDLDSPLHPSSSVSWPSGWNQNSRLEGLHTVHPQSYGYPEPEAYLEATQWVSIAILRSPRAPPMCHPFRTS